MEYRARRNSKKVKVHFDLTKSNLEDLIIRVKRKTTTILNHQTVHEIGWRAQVFETEMNF